MRLNFPWGFNNGEEWRASPDEEFKKYTTREAFPACEGEVYAESGLNEFWQFTFMGQQGLNPVPLGDVPSGCNVITKRLEPGYELLFTSSTGLPCDDPFTVYSTDTCDESHIEFGWRNGDGSKRDVTLRIHSTLEDDSALGNYAIGESFFTHEYADAAETYVAYFRSNRQNDLSYLNNARGIFRVEAQVRESTPRFESGWFESVGFMDYVTFGREADAGRVDPVSGGVCGAQQVAGGAHDARAAGGVQRLRRDALLHPSV